MIELEGYDCKIFTDNIEPQALEQIYDVVKKPEWKDRKVRIMCDCHYGSQISVGFTSDFGEYLNPDYIGCDISCGCDMIFFDRPVDPKDYALFEHRIRKVAPMGTELQPGRVFNVKDFLADLRAELQRAYQNTHGLTFIPEFNDEKDLENWVRGFGMDLGVFYKSIGTVGGGNHLIEYDEGRYSWTGFGPIASPAFTEFQGVLVHTGSRNLGIKVNKYWSNIANESKVPKSIQMDIIAEVKSRPGLDKKQIKPTIDAEIKKWREENFHPGFLSGENLRGYLTDVVICSVYAKWNRKVILDRIFDVYNKLTGGKEKFRITTRHNYIDFSGDTPIIRKGAVSAKEGEIFLLPLNMRDGVAICQGKGNPDTNYSAPHGAGRKMSRSAAKSKVSMKEFEKSMQGIYSTSVCKETLDESPMAYKDSSEIMENIKPCADVLCVLKPKINIKATK